MRRLPDCLCAAGLALVALALWLVYPPLAIGMLGSLLLSAGVILYRRRA